MIVLATPNQKLQAKLAGAVATNECPIVVGLEDSEPSTHGEPTPAVQASVTTGNTAVDIAAAPPAGFRRELASLSVYNADTTAVAVTLQFVDSVSGVTSVITKITLQTLESLFYSKTAGFFAVDANGAVKTQAVATSSAASTASSTAESSGLAASVVQSKLTSIDTVDDANTSTALSTATSAGLAASVATSTSASVDTAQATTTSTADSKGVSAGLADSVSRSTVTSLGLHLSVAESLLKSGGQAGF